MLIFFDNGKLENKDGKRTKKRKFSYIKDKLISHTKLRSKNYTQDKCGTPGILLREICVKWAIDLDIENLK